MSRTALLTIPAAALAIACTTPAPKPDLIPPASWSPVAQGVQATMNPKASPCEDFYEYACGGWTAAVKLPGDRARYMRSFDVIREQNLKSLRALLTDPKTRETPYGARAASFYEACMNTKARDARATTPLAPWLTPIAAVTDTKTLFQQLGRMHRDGMSPMFSFRVSPDPKNPERYIAHISQGGLGLGDRSYYLKPERAALLTAYEEHVARVFSLLGAQDPGAQAKAVLKVERALAAISKERASLRDPNKTYNKLSPEALQELAKKLPWEPYFTELGTGTPAELNIRVPDFFDALPALLQGLTTPELQSYLRWNAARAASGWLDAAFAKESFAFYGKRLGGQREQRDPWKRCVRATDYALPEALGRAWVAQNFSGEARPKALTMVNEIQGAFSTLLDQVDWMDDDTRKAARTKLGTILNKIGHPDDWKTYESVSPAADRYFEAALAARRNRVAERFARLGKAVDHKEWYMSPPTTNAYYTPFGNQIVFPAGILQPPFYGAEHPMAMNFGGIGMVIGHEITHGFDDGGRKFDAQGRLRTWWTPASEKNFEARAQCVEQRYSEIEALPGKRINGKLTLGENIADIGGVRLAYYGYQSWQEKEKEARLLPELTNEQLFFVSFAQTWCSVATDQETERRLVRDSHSPPRWRVNATLSHVPEFHQVFSCQKGTKMYPKDRCQVW